MHRSFRSLLAVAAAGGLCLAGGMAAIAAPAFGASAAHPSAGGGTATPIQHLVVIFQENVSFDHYFATYPNAANTDGNPFHAQPGTPSVNGLTPALLTRGPNSANPQRLTPAQALTCDQDHAYTAEQKAMDGGLMDKFVEETGVSTCSPPNYQAPGLVMDYYDGNTVTGLWNYAQRYAMSDNFYDTEFGPSTPGALDLISGQTFGGTALNAAGQVTSDPSVIGSPDSAGTGTVYADGDPFYDGCSNHSGPTVSMSGPNIGDLLNAKGVSWGWFEGGFAPTSTTSSGTPVCGASHTNIGGVAVTDYIPHHEPFQYYKSTANPDHTPPASLAEVGRGGQANHQYDLSWFFKALNGGNLPSVSFLKAAAYQDGHAGYSDPTDEQHFLVNTINAIQRSNVLAQHRDHDHLRRLGRLVRPPDAADHQLLRRPGHRRAQRPRGLRARRPARRPPGPVRLRPAAAVPAHLALRQDRLRQRNHRRPDLHPGLHREQLAGRAADRRLLVRQPGRLAGQHVQLGPPQPRSLPAGPGHGRARPLTTSLLARDMGGTAGRFLPHRRD
jgi:phospholipase C